MFYINTPRNMMVTTFIAYLMITALSSGAELKSTSLSNEGSSNQTKNVGTPRDANAAAASASACFAKDTLVTLANHQRIPIHELRSGDKLLTTDGTTVFPTQMMMMLDKNTFSEAMFHTIVTASGHSISLTKIHLIPIIQNSTTISYVPAKEVKVGDVLYVMSDHGQMVLSPVTKVTVEVKTGYYAPLTISGTLLGNGIMTSCFANVKSHEAAQWYLSPLRWYFWMAQSLSINEPFGSQNTEGMHFIPQAMYEAGQFLYPSALRSS